MAGRGVFIETVNCGDRVCEDARMPSALESLNRPGRYPLASKYDPAWVVGLDMGPNPLWQLENLLCDLPLLPGQKVLDLGCGKGATSVFLVKECGVDVVGFDLWVSEEELRANLEAAGVADRVRAVHGIVRELPFSDDEFDAILSVGAFEYFGTDVASCLTSFASSDLLGRWA